MTVTLQLPSDIEQGLLAEATSRGMSLDALVEMLIRKFAAAAVTPATDAGGSMVRLEDGMWALSTGHPISSDTVNETIDALRSERDLGNLGILH
jgi:hypothetical protein